VSTSKERPETFHSDKLLIGLDSLSERNERAIQGKCANAAGEEGETGETRKEANKLTRTIPSEFILEPLRGSVLFDNKKKICGTRVGTG